MDKNTRQYHRPRSASTGALPETSPAYASNAQQEAFLAQLAALTGLPQLPQNLPQYSQPTPGQSFSSSSSVQPYMQHFSPGLHPLQSHQDPYTNLPVASDSAGPSSSSYGMLSPGESSYASTTINSPSMSSPSASAEIETNSDTERAGADDKRRRNTEASARFRTKKKLKTINLERSVSDLTGRAEELEREVADLRRENGWLKEIIMLKGTRLGALNLTQHLDALHPDPRTERQRPQTSKGSVSARSAAEEDQGDESRNEGTSSGIRKSKSRE
ncbi:hypothetical protein F5887DRAFT_944167 [Amanita rubescens]|nr:hypothetical protein F5887DRAFT_944167 [Amanita rubescens]